MSVSKWSHSVSQTDLTSMLVMAFRYALGRRSTAPSTVSDLLRAHGHVLESWQREQICKDIEGAIAGNLAGDTCDVRTWREVQERLRPTKEGT